MHIILIMMILINLVTLLLNTSNYIDLLNHPNLKIKYLIKSYNIKIKKIIKRIYLLITRKIT